MYIKTYENARPFAPNKTSLRLEIRSVSHPAIGAEMTSPTVCTEKIKPNCNPVACNCWEITNGIKKSRNKKPRQFHLMMESTESKSLVKSCWTGGHVSVSITSLVKCRVICYEDGESAQGFKQGHSRQRRLFLSIASNFLIEARTAASFSSA